MKKGIVIGSGWSGSGAVFDYLAERPDVADPLRGEEFRLVGDPGGLFDLHSKLKHTFSVQGADSAIKEFMKISKQRNKLSDIRLKEQPVNMKLIYDFIESITAIQYKGLAAYEYQKKALFYQAYIYFLKKIFDKKGKRINTGCMYYPVSEFDFLVESKKLIDSFLKVNKFETEFQCSVVNHGGTFWNPESSTIYYGDRHVFVVTRDPRDVFFELKTRTNAYPADNVKKFTQWYKDMMSRVSIQDWESDMVTILKFEDFVLNFYEIKKEIDQKLGLNINIQSKYDPDKSKLNIGKYKNHLSKEEILYIEKELFEFLNI